MTHPPAKFDVDWSKETQVIVKKLMFDLKPLFLASWQGFYSPIDPQKIPTCILIWSTHLQSLMLIDQRKLKLSLKNPNVWRPDTSPTAEILITRFHLVKTWLITSVRWPSPSGLLTYPWVISLKRYYYGIHIIFEMKVCIMTPPHPMSFRSIQYTGRPTLHCCHTLVLKCMLQISITICCT